MMVYQFIFFDREDYGFEHVESTNMEEALRLGWEVYNRRMEEFKEDGSFESTSAETFEEFVSKGRLYITRKMYDSFECELVTFCI